MCLLLHLSEQISFSRRLHSVGFKLVDFHLRGSLLLSHHTDNLKNIGISFSDLFFQVWNASCYYSSFTLIIVMWQWLITEQCLKWSIFLKWTILWSGTLHWGGTPLKSTLTQTLLSRFNNLLGVKVVGVHLVGVDFVRSWSGGSWSPGTWFRGHESFSKLHNCTLLVMQNSLQDGCSSVKALTLYRK